MENIVYIGVKRGKEGMSGETRDMSIIQDASNKMQLPFELGQLYHAARITVNQLTEIAEGFWSSR